MEEEEFTISAPGVVTLHSRGRIQDVCFRLKHEENVTIECHPVHVVDASPPLSPLHPQRSRVKSVKCVEGDWSFIRIDKGDIASQQVELEACTCKLVHTKNYRENILSMGIPKYICIFVSG